MMNNHNYSNTSKQLVQSQTAAASLAATTTDAVIIQSNSSVVTDEFLQQLQDQFGGENKQIYILNPNNSSGGASLTTVNTDSSSASYNSNNSNTQIQYLIVDKDVDINLILQDPNIFNQPQQQVEPTNQLKHVQQQQPQVTKQFIANSRYSNSNQTITPTSNTSSTSNTANQMLVVEESIQRVQVPPPKRKQFELKLENKKNSYQDVFLRYLAGEKQPTLEIMQSEYAHNAKKPKDNLNYSNSKLSSAASVSTSSKAAMPANNITTTAIVSNQIIQQQSQQQTVNLDKENYYNSSRRENLLPLNNYEYRNSYKDHYDNQGVRVNPAVLKNLSYSTPPAATAQTIATINNASTINSTNNRAVNIPAKKLNEIIASVPVTTAPTGPGLNNQTKSIIIPKTNNEIFSYSNDQSGLNLNDLKTVKSADLNGVQHNSIKLNDLVQSTAISTTTKTNIIQQHTNNNNHHDPVIINEHLQQPVIIEETVTTNNVNLMEQEQLIDESTDEITFSPGEFLIHKSTFSGDFDNYDIWCVRDDGYLQKYEPVLLATGERCHQSADVLAQYTPDKSEFVLVKVEEKGKTEQDNIVVGVLNSYEPKNRKIFNPQLQTVNANASNITSTVSATSSTVASTTTITSSLPSTAASTAASTTATSNNVLVVTYDDLKATLDVFLQALLSQNLNSEFLIKLKEIQDEYFKPSIEFIDSILNEKYVSLMNSFSQFMIMNDKKVSSSSNSIKQKQQLIQFDPLFKYLFETKPKLITQNIQTEARCRCQAIVFLNNYNELLYDEQFTAQYMVKFSGHSYNQDNLIPIDSSAASTTNHLDKDSLNKEFLVCAKTLQFAQMCHTVKHLKIHFYEICQQKIDIVKQISSNNGAPEILNDCLADTQWLMEMFEKFKQLLFEVDNLIAITQNETDTDNNAQLESQTLLNHHLVVDQVTNNLIDDIQLHH